MGDNFIDFDGWQKHRVWLSNSDCLWFACKKEKQLIGIYLVAALFFCCDCVFFCFFRLLLKSFLFRHFLCRRLLNTFIKLHAEHEEAIIYPSLQEKSCKLSFSISEASESSKGDRNDVILIYRRLKKTFAWECRLVVFATLLATNLLTNGKVFAMQLSWLWGRCWRWLFVTFFRSWVKAKSFSNGNHC